MREKFSLVVSKRLNFAIVLLTWRGELSYLQGDLF